LDDPAERLDAARDALRAINLRTWRDAALLFLVGRHQSRAPPGAAPPADEILPAASPRDASPPPAPSGGEHAPCSSKMGPRE
jgi:hypothetical protein